MHCSTPRTVLDSTVRAILTALCDNDRVRAKALGYLDILEPGAKVKARSTEMSQPNTKKRKTTTALSICVQRDEPFHEDSTEKCRYHSGKVFYYLVLPLVGPGELILSLGEMEPDYHGDFWADHDENCHGTIGTDEMRETFPDGFEWTCCDKLGSEAGYKSGRH